MAHEFLSDDWFTEVRKIYDEANLPAPTGPMADLKINIVVTGGPAGDKEIHMAGGDFTEGLAADAPTKLTVPYDIAKAVFVEGNQQAAMQAFMQGQDKVEGDMSKLMAMQTQTPTPEVTALQEKIKAITT
jgi:hypothetical protein